MTDLANNPVRLPNTAAKDAGDFVALQRKTGKRDKRLGSLRAFSPLSPYRVWWGVDASSTPRPQSWCARHGLTAFFE